MTLKELYQRIDGDYEQAVSVLRIEKLMDKHIRKFSKNGVVEKLLEAGKAKDPKEMFESAHALKGVSGNLGLKSGNLGLKRLSESASLLAEEYREGHARSLSDAEVDRILEEIAAAYRKIKDGIDAYEGSGV